MVDPLAQHESAHELEDLIEKAQEGGPVTLAEVAQVAARSGLSVQQVLHELDDRGVKVPSSLVTADDDSDEVEEFDDVDDDEHLASPRLASQHLDDALPDTSLLPGGDDALIEHPHADDTAEVDVPDAPAAIYLRDISRVSLLTAQQEVALAKEIEAGNQAGERLKQLPPWSDESARL